MASENYILVDTAAIRSNVSQLKLKANSNLFAVVKANGYGLGAVEIAKSIEDLVFGFCVATLDEAVELRDAEIQKDILVLGYISKDQYKILSEKNIMCTVYNLGQARELEELGLPIRSHIKIETGHNRLGFKVCEASVEYIDEISKYENLKVEGIYTHFSTSEDSDTSYTIFQKGEFDRMLDMLGEVHNSWMKHISNSGGIIAHDFPYDAVRAGIAIYGVYPSPEISGKDITKLKLCYQWKVKVSNVKHIKAGESVSYSRKFIANRDTKVATLSVGYADGYHRLNGKDGYVLIHGQKAKIIGRITMDQMMVDVTDILVNIGDEATLIGKDGNYEITPDEVATWGDTISYEVLTSIAKRVDRKYY